MDFIRLSELNTNKMFMSGKDSTFWGSGADARYYICNFLEEIDMASEFFIDTATLKLYYYPIEGWQNKVVTISTTSDTTVKFEDSKNIVFKNISIDCGGNFCMGDKQKRRNSWKY